MDRGYGPQQFFMLFARRDNADRQMKQMFSSCSVAIGVKAAAAAYKQWVLS
jgi:hypothetical protein